MGFSPLESEFFGSGILWLLLTFPAYWIFQWTVEGEPFQIWRRAATAVKTAGQVSDVVTHTWVVAGSSLASAEAEAISTGDAVLAPATD